MVKLLAGQMSRRQAMTLSTRRLRNKKLWLKKLVAQSIVSQLKRLAKQNALNNLQKFHKVRTEARVGMSRVTKHSCILHMGYKHLS